MGKTKFTDTDFFLKKWKNNLIKRFVTCKTQKLLIGS